MREISCADISALVERLCIQAASPSVARLAATLVRTLSVAPVSITLLYALHAAARLEFLLSPSPIAPFTALIALQR